MSALAEQVARYSEARARLGYPLTPVKRIRLAPVAPAPIQQAEIVKIVAPAARPETPKQRLTSTRVRWMAIVHQVSIKHNIDAKSLLGPARNRHISQARNEAFYRMRSEIIVAGEPISLPEIARRFGRDHTTVLHGIRVHCRANGLPLPKGRYELSPQSTLYTQTGTKLGLDRRKSLATQRELAHSRT